MSIQPHKEIDKYENKQKKADCENENILWFTDQRTGCSQHERTLLERQGDEAQRRHLNLCLGNSTYHQHKDRTLSNQTIYDSENKNVT